jgi:hypothetical protein
MSLEQMSWNSHNDEAAGVEGAGGKTDDERVCAQGNVSEWL